MAEPVGRPPERETRPPEIAPIFDQPGVLTPPGRLVVEPAFQYGYSSNNRVELVGYTVIPAILIGLIALALAFAAAYLVGAGVCTRLLLRRLGGIDRERLLRTLGRTAIAGAVSAVVALLLSRGVLAVLGTGAAGSLGAVVAAGIVGAVVYLLVALRMRIEELSSLTSMLRGRLGR